MRSDEPEEALSDARTSAIDEYRARITDERRTPTIIEDRRRLKKQKYSATGEEAGSEVIEEEDEPEEALSDAGNPDQDRDERGRWTSGGGAAKAEQKPSLLKRAGNYLEKHDVITRDPPRRGGDWRLSPFPSPSEVLDYGPSGLYDNINKAPDITRPFKPTLLTDIVMMAGRLFEELLVFPVIHFFPDVRPRDIMLAEEKTPQLIQKVRHELLKGVLLAGGWD